MCANVVATDSAIKEKEISCLGDKCVSHEEISMIAFFCMVTPSIAIM